MNHKGRLHRARSSMAHGSREPREGRWSRSVLGFAVLHGSDPTTPARRAFGPTQTQVQMTPDEDFEAHCERVAEDARKLTQVLAHFRPTPQSAVEVCYGPAPFDPDLPAAAQPRAYTVFWMGLPGAKPPERDEMLTVDSMVGDTRMLMWVIYARLDVIDLVERHWKVKLNIPAVRVVS